MSKEKEYTISETTKVIVEYIFNNPNCTKREINKAIARDYKDPEHIRRRFTRKTINENITILLNEKQIKSHDTYKHGKNEYYDIFTVNEEILHLYPELKRIKRIEQLHSPNRTEIEDSLIDKHDLLMSMLIVEDLDIQIKHNTGTKPFSFSNKMLKKVIMLIRSLIYDCFLNNPDLWYCFEKPEDLDFEISIKTHSSKEKFMFESFQHMRDLALKDKYINNDIFNPLSIWLLPEEKRHLDHDNIELFYAKAKLDSEERPKEIEKDNVVRERMLKALKYTPKNHLHIKPK